MSGGSFGYMYSKVQNLYEGELKDAMLEDLLKDFCKVLHDLEWAEDGDISPEDYQKSVEDFKKKWGRRYPELPADRKQFIADKLEEVLPNIVARFKGDLIEMVPKIINSEIKCAGCWCYEAASNNQSESKAEANRWIPVSERLPEDLEPVNITWINHEPESYYKDIKDKPFTATGVYFNGQWYWWSTLCTDTLAEYSHNFDDVIDAAIEITAWRPLPEPYKQEETT